MKINYLFPALMCVMAGLSVSCTTVPEKRAEGSKVEIKSPVKKISEAKSVSGGKKSSVLAAGERMYKRALREKDAKKRHEMFRKVRLMLEKEAARPGEKKEQKFHLRIHLLLAFIADLGQGMESNGIKAAKHYRIAADGGLEEAKIALAEFWVRHRMHLPEAAKQLESIPDLEKKAMPLHFLGVVYYVQNRNDEGFKIFRKVAALPRLERKYIHWMKKMVHNAYERFLKGGNLAAAMKELQREQFLDKKDAMIPYFMGLLENRRNDPAKAEVFFEQSVALNPALPFAYRSLAFLQAEAGREIEALDNIKVAYAVSGRHEVMLQSLIALHVKLKRTKELVFLLELHQKRKPADQNLRRFRSMLYLTQKEYKKAYRELAILLKDPKFSNNSDVLESMAAAATYIGNRKMAVQMCEKILKRSFRPVVALNLAELYVVEEQYEMALALLNDPKILVKADRLARCVIPYLKASALLAAGKKAEKEVAEFEKNLPAYLKENKNDWDVHLFVNWLKKSKTLSESARKEIRRMTDAFKGVKKVKTVKKSPVPVKKLKAQVPAKKIQKK